MTTPLTCEVEPVFVGEQRMTPVCPDLVGPARLPEGVLGHVVVEALGKP